MNIDPIITLANLSLTDTQKTQLKDSFSGVMELVDHIKKLNTDGVEPTSQVTGLTNVTRQDEIDTSRVLTQSQVMANSPSTQNGYFVVGAVFQDL